MLSLLVLGVLFVVAMLVIGVLVAVASLVGFMITLPFRILGWALRLVGLLIALPFMLLAAIFGFGFALVPILPLLGMGWLAWWLLRDRKGHRSQASVVS